MLDWLRSFFSFFLSEWGLLVLSFVDSTVFFFTPLANDIVVVILAARNPDRFWLYPLIATVGSLGGITATYWIGKKLGEPGLERFTSPRALERAKRRVKEKGAFAVGALAIVPPPFPLSPMVLAAGAFAVSRTRFLATAATMRLLRFGLESYLARRNGERIIGWLESPLFQWIIGGFIVVVLAASAYGIYKMVRYHKRENTGGRAPGEPDAPGTIVA